MTNTIDDDYTGAPRPCDFRIVPTHTVPRWHNPFKCDAAALWPNRDPSNTWTESALDEFDNWRACHPDVVGKCDYHQDPWPDAMRIAIRTLQSRDGATVWNEPTLDDGYGDIPTAAILTVAPDCHARILSLTEELLGDPITWTSSTDYLTDGQHRMCALRTAGLTEVAICIR